MSITDIIAVPAHLQFGQKGVLEGSRAGVVIFELLWWTNMLQLNGISILHVLVVLIIYFLAGRVSYCLQWFFETFRILREHNGCHDVIGKGNAVICIPSGARYHFHTANLLLNILPSKTSWEWLWNHVSVPLGLYPSIFLVARKSDTNGLLRLVCKCLH